MSHFHLHDCLKKSVAAANTSSPWIFMFFSAKLIRAFLGGPFLGGGMRLISNLELESGTCNFCIEKTALPVNWSALGSLTKLTDILHQPPNVLEMLCTFWRSNFEKNKLHREQKYVYYLSFPKSVISCRIISHVIMNKSFGFQLLWNLMKHLDLKQERCSDDVSDHQIPETPSLGALTTNQPPNCKVRQSSIDILFAQQVFLFSDPEFDCWY